MPELTRRQVLSKRLKLGGCWRQRKGYCVRLRISRLRAFVSIIDFERPYFNSINAKAEPKSNSQKRENGRKKFNSEFLTSITSAN